MKFLARSKETGNMFKMEDATNPKGYEWYYIAPTLMEYSKTIIHGSDLEIKVESVAGKDTITSIKVLKEGEKSNVFTPTPQNGKFSCIRCGTSLKDGTYKTCYTCSMEIKKEMYNSPEEKAKEEVYKRQTIAHAVSRALIALQGQVELNNINSVIDSLTVKFKEIVG
jgi:hypothetical protein